MMRTNVERTKVDAIIDTFSIYKKYINENRTAEGVYKYIEEKTGMKIGTAKDNVRLFKRFTEIGRETGIDVLNDYVVKDKQNWTAYNMGYFILRYKDRRHDLLTLVNDKEKLRKELEHMMVTSERVKEFECLAIQKALELDRIHCGDLKKIEEDIESWIKDMERTDFKNVIEWKKIYSQSWYSNKKKRL